MAKSNRSAKLDYGKRLKAFRRASDISQEDLAKAIGVHQPYIAAIEAGNVSIGIDKQEEIALCFGVKYYELSNPNIPVPSKEKLRENIEEYVRLNNTDPGYLSDHSPNFTKYIDDLLSGEFLNEFRSAKEISVELYRLFSLEIAPTRVSDILSRQPRRMRIDIVRPDKGRGNRYKLKK